MEYLAGFFLTIVLILVIQIWWARRKGAEGITIGIPRLLSLWISRTGKTAIGPLGMEVNTYAVLSIGRRCGVTLQRIEKDIKIT